MAGLLYLPRIFVYHSETKEESQSETFKVMERKLYNFIMMPAMILSWLFGLLLTHYHFYLGKLLRMFASNNSNKSSKFFRIINEIPTILLIVIVFVVVFKPL